MDDKTAELLAAHDVLAEFYADRLADLTERTPADRAVLDLFADFVVRASSGIQVGDIGCGTGRLAPYLAGRGVRPSGVDLSPEMIRVARRDHPGFSFEVADLRDLPFADSSLAGALCWYSLMYLKPADRPSAFSELARVVTPGGYFVTAFKTGNGQLTRGGRSLNLGIEFDLYLMSPEEMNQRITAAGFSPVFWATRPAEEGEGSPQSYLIARKN